MKKLSNLKGAKVLSKKEQKSINGGGISCENHRDGTHCAGGTYYCCHGACVHYHSFSDYVRTCAIGPAGGGPK